MNSEMHGTMYAHAIEWHIRLRDGNDEIWENFTEWLAEDPLHNKIYESIEALDTEIDPLLSKLVFREAANDTEEYPEILAKKLKWYRWLPGGLIAASIAAAIIFVPRLIPHRYEIVTGAGEHRIVSIDGNNRISLNGSTKIILDSKNLRVASLVSGEALFSIQHDNKHPFTLHMGENSILDVGTVFNVTRNADNIRIAVAEGNVIYNPNRESLSLSAGQALVETVLDSKLHITTVPVDSVGTWQQGHLTYSAAPLSQVASDLARSLGTSITVSPDIANRIFSGAIVLDGKDQQQLKQLSLVLNVDLKQETNGWIMKPLGIEKR